MKPSLKKDTMTKPTMHTTHTWSSTYDINYNISLLLVIILRVLISICHPQKYLYAISYGAILCKSSFSLNQGLAGELYIKVRVFIGTPWFTNKKCIYLQNIYIYIHNYTYFVHPKKNIEHLHENPKNLGSTKINVMLGI